MRMKTEFVVDRGLIGKADFQLRHWPQQKSDVASEGFVPGLDLKSPVRHSRKRVVYLRLVVNPRDVEAEPGANR